ncbi:hypothetical protein BU23DRAFT_104277 [Bimuria novae-zelandiae CBS 107.79]|uniref:Uncharacterized protein n=1 Tax=Bimuria novae-zelandiae CBS 107.79 TaxID=1447943 RepID=A0A6A5W2N8_9PLEO|nr:hypothetical protein BU23DRAFT_104277 [Bimuria novae-zelandiae CBS 107.79]
MTLEREKNNVRINEWYRERPANMFPTHSHNVHAAESSRNRMATYIIPVVVDVIVTYSVFQTVIVVSSSAPPAWSVCAGAEGCVKPVRAKEDADADSEAAEDSSEEETSVDATSVEMSSDVVDSEAVGVVEIGHGEEDSVEIVLDCSLLQHSNVEAVALNAH